ncbi:MAG: helix-turn-helix domain-containing protein [Bacteroidales bacterium]|nr:helix-turn-helix domain-containing protein [Bacteroidales bacterium]
MGNRICIVFCFALNLLAGFGQKSQNPPQDPPFFIPYAQHKIVLDGNLDEWKKGYTFSFIDSNQSVSHPHQLTLPDVYPGLNGDHIRLPLSRNEATVYLCWDRENLYIGFRVKDCHLLGQWIGNENLAYIYLNDAVEVYVDTRNDSKHRMDINDYQFIFDIHNQTSAYRGTLNMIGQDYYAVPKEAGQNLVTSGAVQVSGRLNGLFDSAGWYAVEIRIPFLAIGLEPKAGDTLRFDFGVEDADYVYNDLTQPKDIYYNWAFDWTGFNDFGYPSVWKKGVLTGHPSWFSSLSVKYQEYWVYIVFGILFISLATFVALFFYSRKKSRVPTRESLEKHHFMDASLSPVHPDEIMSYNGKMLKAAIVYIKANCRKPIRSEEVAKHLSVSVRTLQRITGEELDCTPTSLISLIRLREAAEFLRTRQGNVSEAAYEFGFTDPGYFSRLFKQHFGISPTDYLAQNAKSAPAK